MYSHSLESVSGYGKTPIRILISFLLFFFFPFIGFLKQKERNSDVRKSR